MATPLNPEQFKQALQDHEVNTDSWRHHSHKYQCSQHGGYGIGHDRAQAMANLVASCAAKSGKA